MKNMNDLGGIVKCAGYKAHALTAGAASDNAEKVTNVIDRLGYESAVVEIPWEAIAVTDAKKLTISAKIYQADATSYDSGTEILAAKDVFLAANPTLSGSGVEVIKLDLRGYKRNIKIGVTADLNASGTDTAAYGVTVTLGGAAVEPTS